MNRKAALCQKIPKNGASSRTLRRHVRRILLSLLPCRAADHPRMFTVLYSTAMRLMTREIVGDPSPETL